MKYYIALDGGGTKLQGILFDSNYRMLSSGKSGGINRNVHSEEQVNAHIRECIGQLFQQSEVQINRIECVFVSWNADFAAAIEHYCPCGEVVLVGEGCLGILSCGITEGVCALSGTGSDVFYVRDAREIDAIGGWGYLLGDDGSGVWIGRKAVRSMMRYLEEIEEGTHLHHLIAEKYQPTSPSEMAMVIYSAKSPPYELGTLCKIVNQAAQFGDDTARKILCQAGVTMAKSVREMVDKHHLQANINVCTTGSVFQYCTDMRTAFDECVKQHMPDVKLYHAIFEPIVGCIIYRLVMSGRELDEEMLNFLKNEYHVFCT